jgi:hypothetical protein
MGELDRGVVGENILHIDLRRRVHYIPGQIVVGLSPSVDLADELQVALGDVAGPPAIHGFGEFHHIRRCDRGGVFAAQPGDDIGFQPSLHIGGIARVLAPAPFLGIPHAHQFFKGERPPLFFPGAADPDGQLLFFALAHGVDAAGQFNPRLGVQQPRLRQRHIGVLAQGHLFLLTLEAVLPAPQCSPGRGDQQVEASLVGEAVGFGAGRGLGAMQVGQFSVGCHRLLLGGAIFLFPLK